MTDPAASSTLRLSRSEIVSILSGLMLAMFLAGLDQTIVATSLSTMARDLDSRELMSWVASVYLVASTVTTALDTILTAALGLSFGFQLPTVIVPVQNALDLEDTGIGLSAVMFFRLIGGAFGVALLVGELNSGALAIPGHDVLGPNPGIALLHLDRQEPVSSTLLAGLQDTVRAAFSDVFLYAAVISALTTVASFGLKEIPLRSR